MNSTIVCEKQNCPVLLCEQKNQISIPEKCCRQCENSTSDEENNVDSEKPSKKYLRKYCIVNRKVYQVRTYLYI